MDARMVLSGESGKELCPERVGSSVACHRDVKDH